MRATLALLLILVPLAAHARTIVDSAGRKVEVPERIEKVFAAGPPASILIYMLAPEKMTGWPDPPRPEERPFIAEKYRDLPALGRLTGRGGTANLEVVLKVAPDLIVDFGSVRDTYASLAEVGGWFRGRGSRRVLLVSDAFHLLRLRVLAERLALEPYTSPAPASPITANRRRYLAYVAAEGIKVPLTWLFQR